MGCVVNSEARLKKNIRIANANTSVNVVTYTIVHADLFSYSQ